MGSRDPRDHAQLIQRQHREIDARNEDGRPNRCIQPRVVRHDCIAYGPPQSRRIRRQREAPRPRAHGNPSCEPLDRKRPATGRVDDVLSEHVWNRGEVLRVRRVDEEADNRHPRAIDVSKSHLVGTGDLTPLHVDSHEGVLDIRRRERGTCDQPDDVGTRLLSELRVKPLSSQPIAGDHDRSAGVARDLIDEPTQREPVPHEYGGHAGQLHHETMRPRTWIAISTPIVARLATIELPP